MSSAPSRRRATAGARARARARRPTAPGSRPLARAASEDRELEMPDDPFGPDEPPAGPQATQEFRPEWDEEEPEAAPAPHDHRRAHAAAAPARAQPPAAARHPAAAAAALQAPPPRRRAARPLRPAHPGRARARADRRRAVPDQRDLPALPRRPERRGLGDGPERLRRRAHRRDPGVGRRDRLGAAVRGQRDRHDAARQAAPGQVPAADSG